MTQSSKAVWIDKGWTYNGRVLLGSFRVLGPFSGPFGTQGWTYNGRVLLKRGSFRVLGPFSGPFGSSFTVVGSLRVLLGSSFTVVGSLRVGVSILIYSGRVPSGPPRVLIYSGRVPSGPPRVPSGPRSDWSGPGSGGRYLP